MNTEKQSDYNAILERAKVYGFIKEDGTPIKLSEFKSRCIVMGYGKADRLKRIYFGAPNTGGMISVFPDNTRKPDAIKEVYDILIDILVTNKEESYYLDPYYVRIKEKLAIAYGR